MTHEDIDSQDMDTDVEGDVDSASPSSDGGDEPEVGVDDENAADSSRREEHWVAGDKVVSKIKELIHEGNVRRIIIRNEDGRTLIEVPLTLGVGMAILIPVWAAIGAVAAVVTRCSIIVERGEE